MPLLTELGLVWSWRDYKYVSPDGLYPAHWRLWVETIFIMISFEQAGIALRTSYFCDAFAQVSFKVIVRLKISCRLLVES